MNEIVAALLLITFCLFIWKITKSITIKVTIDVKLPEQPAPVVVPGMADLYDEKGNPTQKEGAELLFDITQRLQDIMLDREETK